jgi:hypothetical protein
MSAAFQGEYAGLATPVPALIVAHRMTYCGQLRASPGVERERTDPGNSQVAGHPPGSSLIPSIKQSISDFYAFAETDRAFPSFPAHFVFEPRRLRVRFPSLVAAGYLEKGEDFCVLLANIAGLLGMNFYSRSQAMQELLVLAAHEKELNSAGSPLPRLGLRAAGPNMAELSFESEEL